MNFQEIIENSGNQNGRLGSHFNGQIHAQQQESAMSFKGDIEVDSNKADDGTVIPGADIAVAVAEGTAPSEADEDVSANDGSMPADRQGDNGKNADDAHDNRPDPAHAGFERGAVVRVRTKGHPWWP
jgi:hypothetical protein